MLRRMGFSSAIAFFLLVTSLFGQPQMLRGPYLQSLLADSVKVIWLTAEPSLGAVLVGQEGGETRKVSEDSMRERHEVLLSGLSPSTSYRYEVLDGDAVLASGDDLRFRTPPPPGTGSFRAVLIGDSGDKDVNGE